MNWLEFQSKLILWGKRWNPSNSSIRIPIATKSELSQAQTRFTYQQWQAAGRPAGMVSDYNINIDHPEHEHQHGIHHWGTPAPGVTYDLDDPRPHWTYQMGGLAPGEISLTPEGRIITG